MKLADIKKSIENAIEAELQRAIYNAAGIVSRGRIEGLVEDTLNDIYEDNTTDKN